MTKRKRKGFTIVELVIVIAVIGILAGILIPLFTSLVRDAHIASDELLIRELNNALAIDTAETGKTHETIFDALAATDACGFNVQKINAKASRNRILWDSKNDTFCYLSDEDGLIYQNSTISHGDKLEEGDYRLWVIQKTVDETYSTYLYNYAGDGIITTALGIDASDASNAEITSISYIRTEVSDERTVYIRTNSTDVALIINAPTDVVKHYGTVGSLTITAVAGESYHEYGKVAFAEIKTGRIALEAGAEVEHIHLTATNGNFVNITVAKASSVEMPDFSRDTVEIPAGGKLVVALQDGTNANAEKDYVWLTAVGIYEQVTIGTEDAAGTNYAAQSGNEVQKEAAQQIANNIIATVLGYDYTVKAEKVGNEWVYTLEGETAQTTEYVADYQVDVSADSQVSVMNGTTPVVSTTTVENGIDATEKNSVKNRAINEAKGNLYFTASIEDIGANYYNNCEYLQPNGTKVISIDDYTIRATLGLDDETLYGVTYTSTNLDVADITIELINGDDDDEVGFGFDVEEEEISFEEEEISLDDDDNEDQISDGNSYRITINGKSIGRAIIVITYYDKEDESKKVEYTYNVSVAGTQVMIGEEVYSTLEAAVAAAQDGDTIKLFQDISGSMLEINTGYLPGVSYGHEIYTHTTDTIETQLTGVKNLTLDLNGYSINTTSLSIINTNLEIIDSSVNKTGIINGIVDFGFYFYGDTATLTWTPSAGRYVATNITYNDPTVVTLTGGTIKKVDMSEHRNLVVNGARIINNDPYRGSNYGRVYSVGSSTSVNNVRIEIKSGIVCGTNTDIEVTANANNIVTITGGAFKWDPSQYVDLDNYVVAPNEDGTLWTVYAK